jgi:hypothetical protein
VRVVTAPAEDQLRGTVIEGSLREVALADVLQLLDLSRKTGVLRVRDAVGEREAMVTLVGGRIAAACITPSVSRTDPRETMIELLGWTSGRFSVEPIDETHARPRLGLLGVDTVLMESARRADEWSRLADRVSGPDAVPRLATPDDGGNEPLALAPDEWEVLAYADGVSDLRTLATRTRRDLLAVARAVHRLVGVGFLTFASEADAVPLDDRRSSEV